MDASQLKRYFYPAIVRTNTAQPQDLQFKDEQSVDTQDNVNSLENNKNSQNVHVPTKADARETQNQTDDTVDLQQYPYDIRKLVKHRHGDQYFYIVWTDGSKTWGNRKKM